MKNSVELKQERAGFITEANEMLELCKNETRDFTAEEQVSYDEKMSKIDELKKSIEMIERQEKLNAEIASKVVAPVSNEPKEVRDFSFFKAINDFTNGKLDGVEREMHEEAINEARSAGTSIAGLGIPSFMLESRANEPTQGGSAIAPRNVLGFADAMREASVFNRVGANILTGLSANTTIPVTSQQSVAWATGEVAASADGGADFTKVELSPVRLASHVNISKMLLAQNGAAAEQAIIRDLGRASAGAIDGAIFSTTNVTDAPGSLGATSGVSTITSTATYAANASIFEDFILAEAKLAEVGGLEGNLAYVAHPKLMKDLKRSAQVLAVNAGMQGNLVNGYQTFFTNGCTSDAAASADFYFGDFSKMYMGMFGGLDIMVDPYSVAINGQTRLVLNQYMDWGFANPSGFVKATSLLA
jgi:HK97 family phage major capsid protein